MQKITPFLWFNNQAEEAVDFYVSVFHHSKPISVTRYGHGAPGPEDSVMTVTFEIEGQKFIALNGGPQFSFTPAISFVINCKSQDEIDYYWRKLSEGGEQQSCGWVRDRYGISWQIVPHALPEMLNDPDPDRAARVMTALLTMTWIDIAALKRAQEGW